MENVDKEAIAQASKALKKDPESQFAPFYELTKKRVYFLIYSYVHDSALSEDLLQNAYVTLLEKIHSLACSLNPYSYLCSIAKNLAIDELRKRHPQVDLDDEGVSEVIGENDAPPGDTAPLLEAIKSLLSPFEFQVYILHVLDEKTFKEISHEVHRPLGTLTYTYSAAIDKLQKGLDPRWMNNLRNN
jgi:RNA polymerase sigma-70 factor (ECF subfamily)